MSQPSNRIRLGNMNDVADVAASRNRQRVAAAQANETDATWYNVSTEALAGRPGLLGRWTDILNAMEDFRSAYETGLRRKNLVPDGDVVSLVKTKRGWAVCVSPPYQGRSSNRPVDVDDVE